MEKRKSRREALLIGLGLAGLAAGWQVWIRRPRAFEFAPIEGLPGWRQVAGGAVSGGVGAAVFAGLGEEETVAPLDPGRLCDVLYRGGRAPLPVAVFTDLNCPYCRRIAPMLAARAAEGRIALNWLEWPVFGGGSVDVARSLIAAEGMEGAERLRALLYGGPGLPLSRALSQAGFSIDRMEAASAAPEVEDRLTDIRRAAALLRLPGTPAMTIGRTLVVGSVTPADLDRLIAAEDGAAPVCG